MLSTSHIVKSSPTSRLEQRSTGWQLPQCLLMAFVVIWAIAAIEPVSRTDWLLENLLSTIAVLMLIATRHRLRFSNASYICLFVFLVFHTIGSHYTYALVPYDEWWRSFAGTTLNDTLGWERNHYDRWVHFLYGVLVIPPTVELFARYAPPRGVWKWLMPVFFVTSHAVVYEIVEWLAALVVAPELGNAYLGTQGDIWDAQKDMALATVGSIIAMTALGCKEACSKRAV